MLAPFQIIVSKIRFEVTQHNTEDKEKIVNGFKHLLPESYNKILNLKSDELVGYHKNKILRHYFEISNKSQALEVASFILKNISDSMPKESIKKRLASNSELSIRMNKQVLINSSIFVLDNSSDIYKIKIKFVLHGKPVNKEELIISYITELISSHKNIGQE